MTDATSRLDKLASNLTAAFGEYVKLEPVSQDEHAEAHIDVCTLSYRTDRSNTIKHIRQTALIFEAPDFDLPEFVLSPGRSGVARSLFRAIGGLQTMTFPDIQEFGRAYELRGTMKEAIAILFTPELRRFLADHEGWSIRAKGRLLIIFRHNTTVPDTQLAEFTQAALQVVSLFRDGESALDSREDVRRKATTEDRVNAAREMDGMVGMVIRQQLQQIAISPQELSEFLDAPIPRPIPPGMSRQVLGDTFPLLIVGPIFIVAGIIGGAIAWTALGEDLKWLSPLIGLLPAIIGTTMFVLTFRHRKRKTRLLHEGSLVSGRVARVNHTSLEVNGQRRFVATVEYESGGRSRKTTCNVYGESAERARHFADSGGDVCVIVDPADNSHVVVPDLLAVFE